MRDNCYTKADYLIIQSILFALQRCFFLLATPSHLKHLYFGFAIFFFFFFSQYVFPIAFQTYEKENKRKGKGFS